MAATWEVILRRTNGRFVKSKVVQSRYAAKRLRLEWEEEYDSAYYVDVARSM